MAHLPHSKEAQIRKEAHIRKKARINQLKRQIMGGEETLKEIRRCVEKGWERKSRITEIEEYLEGTKKLLAKVEETPQ